MDSGNLIIPCTIHHIPYTIHHTPYTSAPCTMYHVPCTLPLQRSFSHQLSLRHINCPSQGHSTTSHPATQPPSHPDTSATSAALQQTRTPPSVLTLPSPSWPRLPSYY